MSEGEKPPAAGDGIRSLRTSGMFRSLNFELYARPNKYVMGFGLIAITGCVGYLAWMKSNWQKQNLYTAVDENDELVMRKKRSKWE